MAKKILGKVKEMNLPKPPDDLNITTLFVGGIDDNMEEDSLINNMKDFGKIKTVKLVHR